MMGEELGGGRELHRLETDTTVEGQGDVVAERAAGYGDDLRGRTKRFAVSAIRLYASLPKHPVAQHLGRQAMRAATSVGAHYCEACRARSTAEFVSKVEVGLQELEETCYWLELLVESETVDPGVTEDLHRTAKELNRILTASAKTAKAQRR